MKTRIRSKAEFVEKVNMAIELQERIKEKEATVNDENVFLVLMSEIKEFQTSKKHN
jgi:uncharacterized protein YqeY